jgi:hypothetical protein
MANMTVIRASLDASVGKSVTKMWTLLGGECYGRDYKAGDVDGFLTHIKNECITICGLPFKILDKKAKKSLLNDRRQLLIQYLAKETQAKRVLALSVMHLFQHVKHHVVLGKHLCGGILHCLAREKKLTEELSTALLELAAALESGCDIDVETVDRVKTLALGKS